jgi:DNA-binding PadR family transcriptional regulator
MFLVVIGYCARIMKYPLRNLIYEKIKQAGNMTDAELINILTKDGVSITEEVLDKALLDLEIYGLVRVSWVTKDKRRIETGLVDSSTV